MPAAWDWQLFGRQSIGSQPETAESEVSEMGSNYIGTKLQESVKYSDYGDAAFELYRREGFPVFSLNLDEKQAELRKLIRYDHASVISEKGVIK